MNFEREKGGERDRQTNIDRDIQTDKGSDEHADRPQIMMLGNVHSFIQNCRNLKDKVEFWSCDCIVKETVWNRSQKIDHLAYKYWRVLQGFGIIKMIRNLAQSW